MVNPAGPDHWQSRRLWSLWEIMKRIHVNHLMKHMWMFGDMETYGHLYAGGLWYRPVLFLGKDLYPKHKKTIIEELKEIKKLCIELGLDASLESVEKMLSLTETATKYHEFRKLADELEGRLLDQLKNRYCLSLTMAEAQFYAEPRKGWETIIDRFSATITDIEEMSKCFALGRHAASVFHSLQVVEIGLIELGTLIGAKDHQTGWNATTIKLQQIMAAKHSDRTAFQQQHSMFIEQILATTEILKRAWRNKVSHAQGKLTLLTTDFGAEVAEEIIVASRSFMRRLATEAPANPDPDA